jgi:hypothetical protein
LFHNLVCNILQGGCEENADNSRENGSALLAAVNSCNVSLASSIELLSIKDEGKEELKEEDDRIECTDAESKTPFSSKRKALIGKRKICVEKLELELYVRQACSHQLPVHIVTK